MKRLIAPLAVFFLLLAPAGMANAQFLDDVCRGPFPNNEIPAACKDKNLDQSGTDNSLTGPDGIVSKAANILSVLIGIASFIVIILSGLQFILGVGDPARIASARESLIYALVGIGVALMAQVIVKFVLTKI
jgi:hypothetical protein